MNLIMSEVEETIMLVDADSVANGQGVVNVCYSFQIVLIARSDFIHNVGRKTKNGDAVCKRRWGYSCTFLAFISFILF